MPTVEVNGTTLFHEVVGPTGPPCLVLHGGLGLDHTAYRALDPLTARLQLVYFDHRGNGRSGRPSVETITMEQLADDAVALAGQLGFDRFVVFGHSYGGFVAQELAIRHPDRLLGLVLCSTTPGQLGEGEDPAAHQGPAPPPEVVEFMSTVPSSDEDFAERFSAHFEYYFHKLGPADVAPVLKDVIFDRAAVLRGFELLASWSAVDRLASVKAPTLLVVGAHDVFTSAPQSFRIAERLADSDVVILDESGHFPWLEEPERFFAVLGDWLDRVGL